MVVRKIIRKNSENRSVLDTKSSLYIVIILQVAVLLTGVVLIVSINNNGISGDNQPSKYVISGTGTHEENSPSSFSYSDYSTVGSGNHTTEQNNLNQEPVPSVGIYDKEDVSDFTVGEILALAESAVNKTKAHKGNLRVNHTESFTADVTECTGGSIVKTVANIVIGWVVKPVDEELNFTNGKAVNSEGETIPIILPKKNSFTLSETGIKSARITKSNNKYTIKITLIEEKVGLTDIPAHNASAVGYLDVNSLDLSLFTVDSADIIYEGTVIELTVNNSGLITKAKYEIPLHVEGSAHRGNINGSAIFDGVQSETWILNW